MNAPPNVDTTPRYECRRRILHVVKTSDGAGWAAAQVRELVRHGAEVHVALPDLRGRVVDNWREAGAILHVTPTDISPRRPWSSLRAIREIRALVANIQPEIIHSHFVSSAILLRLALAGHSCVPRLFQVPGPLHLEHPFWRKLEISTATECDAWIASSRCILQWYRNAEIDDGRLYLSYYGTRTKGWANASSRLGLLRARLGIGCNAKVVGNANFIYPPKKWLGQRRGLKAHEDVIDALGAVTRQRSDVVGVLIGGSFGSTDTYERKLRARARAAGGGRIVMTGYMSPEDIRLMWADFDVAVHVPLSENCGGVVEPMLTGVPTIAGRVGGLPEVVIDGITGTTVPIRRPEALADQVLRVLESPAQYASMAKTAQKLVSVMFDVQRTGHEISEIYEHVLKAREAPPYRFDPVMALGAERRCVRPAAPCEAERQDN